MLRCSSLFTADLLTSDVKVLLSCAYGHCKDSLAFFGFNVEASSIKENNEMKSRVLSWLIFIIAIVSVAVWVDLVTLRYQPPSGLTGANNAGPIWAKLLFWQSAGRRTIQLVEGLDLRGGLQVLLEANVPPNVPVSPTDMDAAVQVIRNRIDALGVTEPLVQRSGDRRIVVELPGVSNPDLAVSTIQEQAFLEFVDAGPAFIPEGSQIRTSISTAGEPSSTQPVTPTATPKAPTSSITPTPEITATPPVTNTTGITGTETLTQPERIYTTVISGTDLASVSVTRDQLNQPEVAFTLKPSAAGIFAQFTTAHNEQALGQPYYLCIVLDKVVVSCPSIRSAIPDGQGVITLGSNATVDDASKLAIQLRSGSLPISLRVVQSSAIGPTLGQDSIRKSAIAGLIAMLVVVIYMLLYYRLPGVLADVALLVFVAIVFALYKLIPVTLTLPGLAGLALAVGVAVDANILIFERMKEELRAGRKPDMAAEAGFDRAWPSIRDSNISTLITCVVLFVFGSTYGASIVKGFALTLGLGVAISLFTGIWVTRTFLHLVLPRLTIKHKWWVGV